MTIEEIQAIAAGAIAAKQKATDARAAADEAGGTDEALNAAAETAETESVAATAKAEALSQGPTAAAPDKKAIDKLKRKKAIISAELRKAGVEDESDDDDDEDDLDNPDRPLTVGDLQRIKAREASSTAVQMADAVTDTVARDAIKAALKSVVPSGDPQKDFTNAVAIASVAKNNQVLEEIRRKGPQVQHRSGAGAPIKAADEAFVPTEEEAKYMKAFGLSEADVKTARAQYKP